MATANNPLLLVDNSNAMSLLNDGVFKCTSLTFEEAKAILDTHDESDILRCFTGTDLELIIFDYLGIEKKNLQYKKIRNMRVGQDAIAFKLYSTPSKTQPILITPEGTEAKKVQNLYVFCQLITREK